MTDIIQITELYKAFLVTVNSSGKTVRTREEVLNEINAVIEKHLKPAFPSERLRSDEGICITITSQVPI